MIMSGHQPNKVCGKGSRPRLVSAEFDLDITISVQPSSANPFLTVLAGGLSFQIVFMRRRGEKARVERSTESRSTRQAK